MNRCGSLLLSCLFGLCAPVAAGEVVQQRGAARLQVRWDAAEPTLGLADWITVTLTVEGPTPLPTPTAPLQLATDAKWQLVTRSGLTREAVGANRERCRLSYRFAPRQPGKVAFAFPDVTYGSASKDAMTVSWQPIWFQVRTPPPATLRGITDVEEPAPVAPASTAWIFWLLGGSLLALVPVTAWLTRRLLKRPVVHSHEAAALSALHRLGAKRNAATGQGKRFFSLLHLLVRVYLERRFGLPARRRTTPEFNTCLQACPDLDAEERRFLTEFFAYCDRAKFAPVAVPPEECQRWALAIQQFLERRGR
ncbi:MAG: hypothetical protein HYX68_15655 [Planctomycetes bacterium]|nr:hypothetical protein [Planctomycetota bacterium]